MVGKRIRGAVYVHISARGLLACSDCERLSRAEAVSPKASWNVARIETDIVGLLLYEPFETPFPALLEAVRVDLATGGVTTRNYRNASNPLILHRKELLVDPTDARVPAWSKLTQRLEQQGLFRDNHLIGRRRQWHERLAGAAFDIGFPA